jgi:1,4-dihydroxy-2-naphthoyl-CoA hydrolase
MLWHQNYTADQLNAFRGGNMAGHLGFEIVEVGDDCLKGRMPVDERTTQPFGILHGGANCTLSESLGSIAAWLTINPDTHRAVGIEINCNHIRAITQGYILGTCTALHTGRRTQVWQTDIMDEMRGKRVATSRLTIAIVEQGSLEAQPGKVTLE